MELTERQKQSIEELYGEDKEGLFTILNVIRKRKSIPKIFDKNGYINYTIEEVEKLFNHPNRLYRWKNEKKQELYSDRDYLETITKYFFKIKEEIKKIKRIENLEVVNDELEFTSKAVKRRFKLIVDREIVSIDNRIHHLNKLKEKILESKETDNSELE